MGGDGRAFRCVQVFEVQVADEVGGVAMATVMRASSAVGYRLATLARRAQSISRGSSRQRRREVVNASRRRRRSRQPLTLRVKCVLACGCRAALHQRKLRYCWSPDLAVRADDFVVLLTGPSKPGGVIQLRGGDAQAVGEVNPHLHRVVGIDAVTHQPPFLADGRERDRLAPVVVVN